MAIALLDAGAAAGTCDDEKQTTPLMLAAREGCLPLVRRILKDDADAAMVEDLAGETALEYAHAADKGAVAARLIKARPAVADNMDDDLAAFVGRALCDHLDFGEA